MTRPHPPPQEAVYGDNIYENGEYHLYTNAEATAAFGAAAPSGGR